jgi:hypothetical protein
VEVAVRAGEAGLADRLARPRLGRVGAGRVPRDDAGILGAHDQDAAAVAEEIGEHRHLHAGGERGGEEVRGPVAAGGAGILIPVHRLVRLRRDDEVGPAVAVEVLAPGAVVLAVAVGVVDDGCPDLGRREVRAAVPELIRDEVGDAVAVDVEDGDRLGAELGIERALVERGRSGVAGARAEREQGRER